MPRGFTQVCLLLALAAGAARAGHLRSGSAGSGAGHKIAPGSPSAKWVAGGVHKAHCVDDNSVDAGDLVTKRWAQPLGVQCCDKAGKASRPQCLSSVTYEEAFEHCKEQRGGLTLCSAEQVLKGNGHGTGCGYNSHMVWTRDSCNDPEEMDKTMEQEFDGLQTAIRELRDKDESLTKRVEQLEGEHKTLSEKSPCDEHPCVNGECKAGKGSSTYVCECNPGFSGKDCQTNVDDCSDKPCLNSGLCKDGINGYSCECADGYEGVNCESSANDCADEPCQNEGKCVDGHQSYTCECATGFTGKNCETDIDDCASAPCQNGGTCKDGKNSHTCVCLAGFTGDDCEVNRDECAENPCFNGGACEDLVNGYKCACVEGFDGAQCQNNIDDCKHNPCGPNGAECKDKVNGYVCTCQQGWTGNKCDVNVDDCASEPCKNGATCNDGHNSFSCECTGNWAGSTCETPKLYSNSVVQFGQSFVQIGAWRFADIDNWHFSMAHKDGKTAQIYRGDGTLHPGPRTDWNANSRPLDASAPGIAFGDRFLQIGNWRLCDIDGEHASICTVAGKTAQIFRYTAPTLHRGPRNDYCCNKRKIEPNHPNRPKIGDRYVQIGAWRWGDIDGNHASVSREKNGHWIAAQIWRNDGTLHGGGARNDWYCGNWGPRPACGKSTSTCQLTGTGM